MSTTIPLHCRVDYKIGLDAETLEPAQINEILAQQAIEYCRCLFYLLRQAAISEPHDSLFNHLIFLHSVEQITMIGEALTETAHDQIERLADLKRVTKNPRADRK